MKKIIFISLLIIVGLVSCGVMSQIKQLSKCSFEYNGVENFNIAFVNLDKIKSANDISLSDAAKIIVGITGKTAEISFDIKIKAYNPTKKPVSVDKLEYSIMLEDKDLAYGNLNKPFTISAKGSTIFAIKVKMNASEVVNVHTIKNVYTVYQNITGNNESNTSKLTIKVKPTINNYTFPSYITITKHL